MFRAAGSPFRPCWSQSRARATHSCTERHKCDVPTATQACTQDLECERRSAALMPLTTHVHSHATSDGRIPIPIRGARPTRRSPPASASLLAATLLQYAAPYHLPVALPLSRSRHKRKPKEVGRRTRVARAAALLLGIMVSLHPVVVIDVGLQPVRGTRERVHVHVLSGAAPAHLMPAGDAFNGRGRAT